MSNYKLVSRVIKEASSKTGVLSINVVSDNFVLQSMSPFLRQATKIGVFTITVSECSGSPQGGTMFQQAAPGCHISFSFTS